MSHSVEDVLIAGLRLRFGRHVVEARLYFPPNAGGHALVLLLADDATWDGADLLGRGLTAGAHVVVLCMPDRAQRLAALQWAADHARELGGRPDRLMVAGRDISGARAAYLAARARDNRWPVLYRQVLLHPRFTKDCPLPARVTSVAPATIVSASHLREDGGRYAAVLRRSGVDVHEIWRSEPDDDRRMVADLARALPYTQWDEIA